MPGTFNPPTHAHLAMAEAAVAQCRLDRLDWVVSRVSLGKEQLVVPAFDDRISVLHSIAEGVEWLSIVVTNAQLIADIARGYDVLVVGADKWEQIVDPGWYPSVEAHTIAVAKLPRRILVAPRQGSAGEPRTTRLPSGQHDRSVDELVIDHEYTQMSSTLARTTMPELMVEEAAASGLWPTAS